MLRTVGRMVSVMVVVVGFANVAQASPGTYGPRREAPTGDLGPVIGDWLEYVVQDGQRVILERCTFAAELGISIVRTAGGFVVQSREAFEVVQYDVVGVRRDGGRYEIDLTSGRSLDLAVDASGKTAVLTWSGSEPMRVAGPTSGFPAVDEACP
jgi:hypothetical protein